MRKKQQKKTPYCSEDLRVNKGLTVKIKTTNINQPSVIELGFSLYAVPKENKTDDEYVESIDNIRTKFNKIFKAYLKENPNLFNNKSIMDFSFSSANLKKGYNKYVTTSLYLQQIFNFPVNKLKSKVKETIKNTSFQLTSAIQEEGFSCYKNKHK